MPVDPLSSENTLNSSTKNSPENTDTQLVSSNSISNEPCDNTPIIKRGGGKRINLRAQKLFSPVVSQPVSTSGLAQEAEERKQETSNTLNPK